MSERAGVLLPLSLAAVALILLFALVPHGVYGDGYIRFVKVDNLLRHGTLGSERYSYIGPLFASPLWVFGDARLWWCARFNALVLAAGAAGAWFALRPALAPAERASVVLLLAAAGMLPNATRDFYGEMFSAVTVGTGLMLVASAGTAWGWLPIAAGVANMPASAGGLLLTAIWRRWKWRRSDGLIALVCAAALILLENTIVRGAPFNAGYAGDHGATTVLPFSGMSGFSYPMLLGALSLLFSFGKGVMFFAPGLLLVPFARRERPAIAPFLDLSLAFLAGLLGVYSKWWAWYGGWSWGPRFLLFAAYPSAVALAVAGCAAVTWRRRAVTVAVACWTVWVGISGVVFGLDGLDDCIANGYALEHLCWYVPEYSPLLRPLVLRTDPIPTWGVVWMLLCACVAGVLLTAHAEPDRRRS